MSTDRNKYSSGGFPFEEVWERITTATDMKTFTDLGDLLGKRQQTISASKQKNLFPYGWAYPVAEKYGLLTEWILTGRGPKRVEERLESSKYQILWELEQWLDCIVPEEPMRLEWFTVSVEDAFPLFRDWKHRHLK